ncbi:MAG: YopX family protein [bacterium]
MREIKFRAWDKTAETMYENVNIQAYRGYGGYNISSEGIFVGVNCERFILMQYTGLKDKNGQEIYEGDIVKGKVRFQGTVIGVKGQVIYNHCRFVIGEYNCELYQFSNNFDGRGTWIEVIGNKYENPELLEG